MAGGDTVERELQQGFERIVEVLEAYKARGVEYRIVGGTALSAVVDHTFPGVRKNGSFRDVDVIILSDEHNQMTALQEELKRISAYHVNTPPVELNSVRDAGHQSSRQLLGVFAKLEGGGFALRFRDIQIKVPDALMRAERVSVTAAGTILSFDSFPIGTLLHLYIKRSGSLKHKDVEKIGAFSRSVSRSGAHAFGYDHAPYQVFHDFAKEIRKRYPIYSQLIRTYNCLDDVVLGGFISHRLIPRKVWKRIIDS